MAFDNKYGRVSTEKGSLGEDEIVVVFRAQDKLLPEVMAVYRDMCERSGSPEHHLQLIDKTRSDVLAWQEKNYTQVPQSKELL